MIEILPFANQYLDGVVDLILPIQQQEFDIPISLGDQPDLLDIPGFYQKGKGNFWVALEEGKVVGTSALLDLGSGVGALRKMFVKKAFRGAESGIAQGLLQVLLAWAKDLTVTGIYLGTTVKFQAAHRFYEKNGFLEIRKSELPSVFPIMQVDTKFYKYARSSAGGY